ncbi:MAG TPA: M28 family peptidase [Terriglobales bacterium]|nr:M28 family peptidase [Terriglobales bacterium]
MIVPESRRRWLVAAVPALLMLVLAPLALKRLGRLPEASPATQAAAPLPSPVPASTAATTARELPQINAARAMQYVREVVAFGPRPIGSASHKKLEAYLLAHLKGVTVEHDEFTASTPEGQFPIHNIIAKFPGTKPGAVVIATHYDTLMSVKNFVGANDGGSGTGLLLELANQLRGARRSGYSVWLVWLDGEEAVHKWSATDSTYGSRHLAEKWQKDGTLSQVKAFLLADMIGDADLNIDRDQNSTPWLEDLVFQAASKLGYQSHFFARGLAVDDDHLPFARAGVPVADLIDFDYGYNNVFWHTPQDTLDKLSPKSLQITGDVLLETVRLLDQK